MTYKLVEQGADVPPSEDITKRDARWSADQYAASLYGWGRMDAGESRDVNKNYAFSEAWADAQWLFRREIVRYLPCMNDAYVNFHNTGKFL